MKYAFYDHHMADFGKRSLYLFLFTLLFSAFLRTNLMFIFIIIEFLYFVYLYYSRIEINYEGDKRIMITQKGQKDITIHLPIEAYKWWNYFPNKQLPFRSMSGKSYNVRHNRQNIVMSYLEVTDATNQKINFVEKIVYGTRFPNEAEYSLKIPDDNRVTLKTNRTDKIFDFFIDCTYQA